MLLAQTFPRLAEYTEKARNGEISIRDYSDLFGLAIAVYFGWSFSPSLVSIRSAESFFPSFDSNPLYAAVAPHLWDGKHARLSSLMLVITAAKEAVPQPGFLFEYFTTAQQRFGSLIKLRGEDRQAVTFGVPVVSFWEALLSAHAALRGAPDGDRVRFVPVINASKEQVESLRTGESHPVGLEVERPFFADLFAAEHVSQFHFMIHDLFNHAAVMSMITREERTVMNLLRQAILENSRVDQWPTVKSEAELLLDFTPRYDPVSVDTGLETAVVNCLPMALYGVARGLVNDLSKSPGVAEAASSLHEMRPMKSARAMRRVLQKNAEKQGDRMKRRGDALVKELCDSLTALLPQELRTPLRLRVIQEFQRSWIEIARMEIDSSRLPAFREYAAAFVAGMGLV